MAHDCSGSCGGHGLSSAGIAKLPSREAAVQRRLVDSRRARVISSSEAVGGNVVSHVGRRLGRCVFPSSSSSRVSAAQHPLLAFKSFCKPPPTLARLGRAPRARASPLKWGKSLLSLNPNLLIGFSFVRPLLSQP